MLVSSDLICVMEFCNVFAAQTRVLIRWTQLYPHTFGASIGAAKEHRTKVQCAIALFREVDNTRFLFSRANLCTLNIHAVSKT